MNPVDKQKLANVIKELSDSMTRVDAEKELQRDIIQVTFENEGFDKKKLRKLATMYHKQNATEVRTEAEDVFELYEELFQ
jgi:uncharacterized protein (UPF0335 family)